MADLSGRARAVATSSGDIIGTRYEQRVMAWLAFQEATGPLNTLVKVSAPPAVELGVALYRLAVVCGLWGVEITEALDQAVLRAEMTTRKTVKGSTAPVPNAKDNDGTLRDRATGLPPEDMHT